MVENHFILCKNYIMKILVLGNPGSIHLVRLVNALSNEHEVILFFQKNHKPYIDHINLQVKLFQLPFSGIIGYYLNSFFLKKSVKLVKPDIINVHYASGYGTLSRLAKLNKTVLHVWGSDILAFPKKSLLSKITLQKNLDYAKCIVGVSYNLLREVKKLSSNPQIHYIPFGVNLSNFPITKPIKKKNQFTIGMIKALHPIYGVDVFVKSIKIVKEHLVKSDSRVTLNAEIYGSGPLEGKIKNLIKKLDLIPTIKLGGYIENKHVPKKLSTFDLFCATSHNEGFGVSLIEAMASCKPVLATNNNGFSEIITHKKNGHLVPINNPEKLAEAILLLMNNEAIRHKYSIQGRLTVEKKYNYEKNISALIILFKKIQKLV